MKQLSLIAVHGNGGGGFRFERARPYYPANVEFVAPTLPGFAGTPPDPALQSLTDYAAVLQTHILKTSAPRVLLGTGIGGAMVLEYLQHYAADVAGVMLHAPVGTRLDERTFPKLMRMPGMTTLGKWVFSASPLRPMWRPLLFTAPVPLDYSRRFFDEYARCDVFGQMFEIINAEWFASLQPVDLPAVLLWGERERILSVDQLEDYKVLLPNHTVRTVPEWDHFPMIDAPQAFADETTRLAAGLLT
ncbi:MAG: alpha/beta hydrolase [Chloroflexota bacterium]